MTYLICMKDISIGKVDELYSKGYQITFNYNFAIPYLEIFVSEQKEKEFNALVSI